MLKNYKYISSSSLYTCLLWCQGFIISILLPVTNPICSPASIAMRVEDDIFGTKNVIFLIPAFLYNSISLGIYQLREGLALPSKGLKYRAEILDPFPRN